MSQTDETDDISVTNHNKEIATPPYTATKTVFLTCPHNKINFPYVTSQFTPQGLTFKLQIAVLWIETANTTGDLKSIRKLIVQLQTHTMYWSVFYCSAAAYCWLPHECQCGNDRKYPT